MTWPVDPLPIATRANSTPMLDLHPGDHNALDTATRTINRDAAAFYAATDVFNLSGASRLTGHVVVFPHGVYCAVIRLEVPLQATTDDLEVLTVDTTGPLTSLGRLGEVVSGAEVGTSASTSPRLWAQLDGTTVTLVDRTSTDAIVTGVLAWWGVGVMTDPGLLLQAPLTTPAPMPTAGDWSNGTPMLDRHPRSHNAIGAQLDRLNAVQTWNPGDVFATAGINGANGRQGFAMIAPDPSTSGQGLLFLAVVLQSAYGASAAAMTDTGGGTGWLQFTTTGPVVHASADVVCGASRRYASERLQPECRGMLAQSGDDTLYVSGDGTTDPQLFHAVVPVTLR